MESHVGAGHGTPGLRDWVRGPSPGRCPLTLPRGMGYTKRRLSFSLRKREWSFSFTMKMMSAGMMLGPWAGEVKG